jgi:putative nucleotidyltransferase with HDIG domain
MNLPQPFYRVYQFFFAIFAKPDPQGLANAQEILSPAEWAIFCQLQPSEQAHAIIVLQKVATRAPEASLNLRKAALLHDVGKAKQPLHLWERVAIVLGQALFGKRTSNWTARPFLIRSQHPSWGAEMATEAGSPAEVISLIRRHQDKITTPRNDEDKLLLILQSADDES